MKDYKLLWSDLHTNLHHHQMEELESWYNHAKEIIDFWPIAYYPFYMRKDKSGLGVEDIYEKEIRDKDWEQIKAFTKKVNMENKNFPMLIGYEWQGAGLDGDHNVFYLEEEGELHAPNRYEDLCKALPKGKAIAIPHHLAYSLGHRGKNWSTHNPEYSPFAEIYSSHGSSESGYTDTPMTRHIHMGPRTGGTSVFDGLALGNEVGIIASGDNHSVPAMYGHGYMACYSEDSTKEKIWEALLKRHVYGVTGNKIKLKYSLNSAIMGDKIKAEPPYNHSIEVEAGDAINRIELLRNNILVDEYTHSGKWEETELRDTVTFKFKIEFGWGPDLRTYPNITSKVWKGSLETSGEILDIEKCWTSHGQKLNWKETNKCDFELTTYKTSQSGKWMGPSPVTTEGFIFEIKAPIDSEIILKVDEKEYKIKVNKILENTQVIALLEESKALAKGVFGFEDYYRSDPFYHNAYKIRINRGTPDIGYKVKWNTTTLNKKKKKDYYLIKVYQRDGNLAWSSPIWVE